MAKTIRVRVSKLYDVEVEKDSDFYDLTEEAILEQGKWVEGSDYITRAADDEQW